MTTLLTTSSKKQTVARQTTTMAVVTAATPDGGGGNNEMPETIPRSKSNAWHLAQTFGGWRSALVSQRRQSTRLIEDMVHGFDHVIDGDDNVLASTLTWFEKITHVNRRYLFIATVLLSFTYLSMGRNAGSLCNILAMVYPIYASIKASENMTGYAKDHWLMYWIVFSIISFLEVILEIFLVWLPMYYLIKFLFLCWCMAPIAVNGSHVIYIHVIRPLFHQHNEKVETALSAVTQKLTDMSSTIPQHAGCSAAPAGTTMADDSGNVRERRTSAPSSLQ